MKTASAPRVSTVFLAALFAVLTAAPLSAQDSGEAAGRPHDLEERPSAPGNLWTGFKSSVSPWDSLILAVGVAGQFDGFYSEHHIDLPPFRFDRDFTELVARDDEGYTFGSRIGPDRLAFSILSARLAATLILDQFTETDVDADDYRRSFFFGKALLLNLFVTDLTKDIMYQERPDGSDARSFFSGHASSSFTFTSYLYCEADDWLDVALYGEENKARRVAAKAAAFAACYGWASYVGGCRIYDRKHYLSDVLVGAAVGTTIGNLMYSRYKAGAKSEEGGKFAFRVYPSPSVFLSVPI